MPPVNGSTVARRRGGAAVGLAPVSWVIVLIVFARVFARACTFLLLLYERVCARFVRLREIRSLAFRSSADFTFLGVISVLASRYGSFQSFAELLSTCLLLSSYSQPLSVWTWLQSGVDKVPLSR